MYAKVAVVATVACALMIGCAATESSSKKVEEGEGANANQMNTGLPSAYNSFGLNLFAGLTSDERGKNVFISPLSIATALTMVYTGSAAETKEAMAKALSLGRETIPEVSRAAADLRRRINRQDSKVELTIANSLWARNGVRFRNEFLDRNREFFGAEISTLDFADPKSTEVINQWVDSNTKGKIKRIVEQIDAQTVMYLINAIYFKGKWKSEFDKALTGEGTFRLLDGGRKPVMLMSQGGNFPYLKGERFQAINLPYADGSVSMYIFLPNETVPLPDFLKQLTQKNWDAWMNQFRPSEGEIKLPRFKVEYEKDLNDPLKKLGMEVAFDAARANFEGMRAERDLFIQNVKHKAVAEVNEEGTEAAAATSVAIGITSVRMDRFTLIVDRPFLMAIRDNSTGSLLFLGAVYDPQ